MHNQYRVLLSQQRRDEMKPLYVVLIMMFVFATPVFAVPDCPPTATPPVTVVALNALDGPSVFDPMIVVLYVAGLVTGFVLARVLRKARRRHDR